MTRPDQNTDAPHLPVPRAQQGTRGPHRGRIILALCVAFTALTFNGEAHAGVTPVVQAQGQDAPTITNLEFISKPFYKDNPDYPEYGEYGDAYYPGETVAVAVTFSEAVTVTGMPTLTLDLDMSRTDDKPLAKYKEGSGTAELTFEYVVAPADRDDDGLAIGANSLGLNGGTVQSQDSVDAVLTHEVDLPAQADHKVALPVVRLVGVGDLPSSVHEGESLRLTVRIAPPIPAGSSVKKIDGGVLVFDSCEGETVDDYVPCNGETVDVLIAFAFRPGFKTRDVSYRIVDDKVVTTEDRTVRIAINPVFDWLPGGPAIGGDAHGPGRSGTGEEHPGGGSTGDQRRGAGGRDADGQHDRHQRCGWPDKCGVQLPMAP